MLAGAPSFAGWLSDDALVVPIQEPSSAAVIDADTGTITKEIAYADSDCLNPGEIQRAASGRVFMVCEGNHFGPGALVELDPESLEVRARVELDLWPDRLAIPRTVAPNTNARGEAGVGSIKLPGLTAAPGRRP